MLVLDVYIVVSPIVDNTTNGKQLYRVAYATKVGVRPFGPELKKPPIYEGEELRKFLLYKLINSEKAAMVAPPFASKLQKTREVLLNEVIEDN